MSKTPSKRRHQNGLGEQKQVEITPKKNPRISDEEQQTPSPSRLSYQLNALDAALNHYFSPKKKSPGRSPGRSSQRQLLFVTDELENGEKNGPTSKIAEKGTTKRPQRLLKFDGEGCDLSSVKLCFQNMNKHLPEKRIAQYQEEGADIFAKWLMLLRSGEFNILVHGLGSKQKLLAKFQQYLKAYPVFVVDGLNQRGVSIQSILERIGEEIIRRNVRTRKMSLKEWAQAVVKSIDEQLGVGALMVLIVHNMDSPQLRPRACQEAFSILARSKTVRIVASVDHVNAALLWNQNLRDAFNWLYFPISTLHCYHHEVLEGGGKLLGLNSKGNDRRHTIESLDMFWEATTSNMRKILEQLAIHAPLPSERNKRNPLTFPKFCQILKEEFATTSETALRQQMVEFRDHSLVKLDNDGNIQLSVDRQLLSAFLDKKTALG